MELIDKLKELQQKRTKGEWFWSNRTLRSEVLDDEGDLVGMSDILYKDTDHIYGSEEDMELIALAPLMAETLVCADMVEGWQPIETGPKDGSDVNILCESGNIYSCFFLYGEWQGNYYDGYRLCNIDEKPVAWMPPVSKAALTAALGGE